MLNTSITFPQLLQYRTSRLTAPTTRRLNGVTWRHFGADRGSLHSHQAKAERLCRGTQLTVQRGERKVAPLGKLQIGRVMQRETETISQTQRFAPGVDVRVVVCGDVQERQISESRAAELAAMRVVTRK
jgi:hypothetical protein